LNGGRAAARRARRYGNGRVRQWILPIALVALIVELVLLAQAGGLRQAEAPIVEGARIASPADAQPTSAAATSSTPEPDAKPTAAPVAVGALTPASPVSGGGEGGAPAQSDLEPAASGSAPVEPAASGSTVAPTAGPTRQELAEPLAAESSWSGPADTVASFYGLISQHEFDLATRLWSARMQAAYPPGQNIYGRFAQTQRISIRRADVVALDQAAGRATVAVDVAEVIGSPPTTRRWVGTWHLVRVGSGWLLDQPSLQPG
jgi:hypothetical protein